MGNEKLQGLYLGLFIYIEIFIVIQIDMTNGNCTVQRKIKKGVLPEINIYTYSYVCIQF